MSTQPLPNPPPARPLDAIAADLGNLVADVVFAGERALARDWDEHCKRWRLCGK